MSRKDYERLCSELDNTRQKDHPHAYEALSQAQFKGAMLFAGKLTTEKGEQNWHFKIKPAYDEKSFSHDVASQNKRLHLPAYRSTPQGEQDPGLNALVQKVLASHRGDDTYGVMI